MGTDYETKSLEELFTLLPDNVEITLYSTYSVKRGRDITYEVYYASPTGALNSGITPSRIRAQGPDLRECLLMVIDDLGKTF